MLRIRNVDAGYGKLSVLRRVSLHVSQGEIVTIVGANGAGKTTLLRTVAGLVRARARLMMLDEPSMGLAPLVMKDIFAIVKRISDEGTTVLLVEQNARSALRIATRGYVLETGRIVLQGTAEELLANRDVQRAYLGSDLDAENRVTP